MNYKTEISLKLLISILAFAFISNPARMHLDYRPAHTHCSIRLSPPAAIYICELGLCLSWSNTRHKDSIASCLKVHQASSGNVIGLVRMCIKTSLDFSTLGHYTFTITEYVPAEPRRVRERDRGRNRVLANVSTTMIHHLPPPPFCLLLTPSLYCSAATSCYSLPASPLVAICIHAILTLQSPVRIGP